jgi:FolB domain-containing protein
MDQVFIKDLLVRGIIGINDWEREKPQDIMINIVIYADLTKAGQTDDIAESVNYRTISKRAQARAETAQRLTVEALAEDIAGICLEEKGVIKVRVKVEKPNAVRFARSVGVEVERSRK